MMPLPVADAAQATLGWDSNPEPDLEWYCRTLQPDRQRWRLDELKQWRWRQRQLFYLHTFP